MSSACLWITSVIEILIFCDVDEPVMQTCEMAALVGESGGPWNTTMSLSATGGRRGAKGHEES